MIYHPRDKGLWDLWMFHHEGTCHCFYLQLMERDSWRQIGHATSSDLLHWREEEPALLPGTGDDWDNAPLGSGMVFAHEGTFCMMYFTHVPKSASQKMGLAMSDDLFHWRKHPANPVFEPSMGAGIYEHDPEALLDRTPSWRDPHVCYDPQDGKFHMLFAARLRAGPYVRRGCIGHAVSADLVDWDVLDPVYAPGAYYDHEVPEHDEIEGRHFLLWSCIDAYTNHRETPSRTQCGGTWYAVSNAPYDGYSEPADNLLVGSGNGRWDNYVGRIVEVEGEHVLYYFMRGHPVADYTSLSAPKSVRVDADGHLIAGYCDRCDAWKGKELVAGIERDWLDAKDCLDGEEWSLDNGVLSARVDGSYGLPTHVSATDFMLECDVMLDDAFFAGVGMTDYLMPGRGAVLKHDKFGIDAGVVLDGRSLKIHVLGNTAGKTGPVLKPLDSMGVRLRPGEFRRLRVVVRAPWTDVFLDDWLCFSLALPWPAEGRLVLLACDGTARFRNLRVHELKH